MKKNLAKRIVLGLLTGAVLMSSSVAWAEYAPGTFKSGDNETSIYVGIDKGSNGGGVGDGYANSVAVGDMAQVQGSYSVALGANSKVSNGYSVALGTSSYVEGSFSVALGYGSVAVDDKVVSVGNGGDGLGPKTRSIINVEDVADISLKDSEGNYKYGSYAVNVNTLNAALENIETVTDIDDAQYDNYAVNVKTLRDALANISGDGGNSGNFVETETDNYGGTKTDIGNNFVITDTAVDNSTTTTTVTINENDANNPIVMNTEGITVGTNSTRMDGTGFYVWDDTGYDSNTPNPHNKPDAIAAVTNDGTIKGVNGTFSGNVTANNYNFKDSNGSYTDLNTALSLKANVSDVYTQAQADSKFADKAETQNKLNEKADKTALEDEKSAREQGDQNLQSQIDQIGSGAIAGLNQRLEKTNAKINKVGAGAAALAALHPLDYDPDDKLTFSAGMGNYAGENAAALGAFYRPNEKFMLSLGGTMGNGENMVNLGLSIGLDKPNGFAKMSKRELIQEVNAVKAENEAIKADNEAMKDQLANADERIAKLEALVAQLASK